MTAVHILQRTVGVQTGDHESRVLRAKIASAKKSVDGFSNFREWNSSPQSLVYHALQQRSQNSRRHAFPRNIGYRDCYSIPNGEKAEEVSSDFQARTILRS